MPRLSANVTEVWLCDFTDLGDTGTNPDIESGPRRSLLVLNSLPVNNSPPVLLLNKLVSNEVVSLSLLDDVWIALVPDAAVTSTTKTKSAAVFTKKMVDEWKCEITVLPTLAVPTMPEVVLTTTPGTVTGTTPSPTTVLTVSSKLLLNPVKINSSKFRSVRDSIFSRLIYLLSVFILFINCKK